MATSNRGRRLWAASNSSDARQFQTHNDLLARTSAQFDATGRVSLNAIIVPASRSAANLDHAITMARAVGCRLVVLCSHGARSAEVNDLLAARNFAQAVVVDLPEGYRIPGLDFATSDPGRLGMPGCYVNPNGDLSIKRNVGLLLARMMGWERIFFMDDDIRDLDFHALHTAASMLGPYRAVGMPAANFPDNSVVCHGHRETGEYQDVFVSGSALAVHCADSLAFFPEIYNEDWFFFYHAASKRRLGSSGRNVTQLSFDPFADPQRAAGQEFGDVMAEGLYSLLHQRMGADRAGSDYWKLFLDSRMRFLNAIIRRAATIEPYQQARITNSIKMAMECAQQITPATCEHYIKLWKLDLDSWEQWLKGAPKTATANAALGRLGLTVSTRSLSTLTGITRPSAGGITGGATAGSVGIPSKLAPREVWRLRSIPAAPVADSRAAEWFPMSVSPHQEHAADISAQGIFRRAGKRIGQFLLHAALKEERPKPTNASRIRDGGRPPGGRHRKSYVELITYGSQHRRHEAGDRA